MKRWEEVVVIAQALGSVTAKQISERWGVRQCSVVTLLTTLRDAGVLHVTGWARHGKRGTLSAVYAFGYGVDAPRPPRTAGARYTQAYLEKARKDPQKWAWLQAKRQARLRRKRAIVNADPLLAILSRPRTM